MYKKLQIFLLAVSLCFAVPEPVFAGFALLGTTITQTGTDTNLGGLSGVSGVTLEDNTYILDGVRLEVQGNLTMSGWLEKLQFRNSPNAAVNNSTAQIAVPSGGVFTVLTSRTINGGTTNRLLPVIDFGYYGIDFGVTAFHGSNNQRHIACDVGGTVNLSGIFTGRASGSGLAYAFDGTSNFTDAYLINQGSTQGSNQQVAFAQGGDVTIDNLNIVGLAYTDRGGNFLSVDGLSVAEDTEGFVWNFTTATSPQYLVVNGFNPQQISVNDWRTNMSNVNSNGSVVNLINTSVGNSLTYNTNQGASRQMRALITNVLNITPVDGDFLPISTKVYAVDNDNGNRDLDFNPAGQSIITASTDIIYTDTGSDITFNVISGIINPDESLDARGIAGGADLLFAGIAYNYTIATYQPNLTGLGDKYISPIHLDDTSITQQDATITATYLTQNDAYQAYDALKLILVNNYAGETETIATRAADTLNCRGYDVVINAVGSGLPTFDGSTITINSATFGGNITTTGEVILAGGAVMDGVVDDVNGTTTIIRFK